MASAALEAQKKETGGMVGSMVDERKVIRESSQNIQMYFYGGINSTNENVKPKNKYCKQCWLAVRGQWRRRPLNMSHNAMMMWYNTKRSGLQFTISTSEALAGIV